MRFDTAHDCPHKDILGSDGKIKRKVWFEMLDNKQGLDMAIKDLKDNYQLYVERYVSWQKKADAGRRSNPAIDKAGIQRGNAGRIAY